MNVGCWQTRWTNFRQWKMLNGKWLPILCSAGKRQHSVSFVYRSYHLPMPLPSPSTLTVKTPTSYSSEEAVAAGHSGQFTPMRLPVNTVIHTTLVGLEPATFQDRWSDALPVLPPSQPDAMIWCTRVATSAVARSRNFFSKIYQTNFGWGYAPYSMAEPFPRPIVGCPSSYPSPTNDSASWS